MAATCVALCLLVGLRGEARAQLPPGAAASVLPARPRVEPDLELRSSDALRKARRLRNSGIGLVVSGLAVAGASAGLMAYNVPSDRGSDAGFVAGVALLGVASTATITGVVLWIVGQRRIFDAEARGVFIGRGPSGAQLGGGVGVRF